MALLNIIAPSKQYEYVEYSLSGIETKLANAVAMDFDNRAKNLLLINFGFS